MTAIERLHRQDRNQTLTGLAALLALLIGVVFLLSRLFK